jgi:hypothetical protein
VRKGIGFAGTVGEFRTVYLPAIRKCGMLGLRIGKHALRIQARTDRATSQQGKVA